jgi:sortase (surface protein transpeptidase)
MILAEEGQEIGVRLENARWLQPSDDERLTLVTCWPQWSNTHRLIIVARPE